jgi:NitT/TauT family transport system substrate-binding protein
MCLIVAACRPAIANNNTDTGSTAAPGGTAAIQPGPTQPPPSLFGIAASDLPPTDTPEPSGVTPPPITPEPSLEEISTAVPAEALKPANQVSLNVQLFHGLETTDAALLYADALDHYTAVNLIDNVSPPIAGYQPFAVNEAPDTVTVWIGTVADVAPAAAAGVTLEAVGELSGRDTTVLVVPKKGGAKSVADLKGKVLYDNPEAAAALKAAGLPSGATLVGPADPSAPFDPSALLDGTAKAAAVSSYEGWARILEAAVNSGMSEGTFVATPLHPQDTPVLGELIWVQPSDLTQPDIQPAIAAFLGVVAQSQVECRDNLDDCVSTAATQSDRTPDGIAWSLDQLDGSLFPSTDGILHIDPDEWNRTIAMATAAKVQGISGLTFTDDIVNQVLQALSSLDIYGKDFKPEGRKLFP